MKYIEMVTPCEHTLGLVVCELVCCDCAGPKWFHSGST